MLVKDNKFQLIQINNTDPGNRETDAVIWYLKRGAEIFESICGVEHPFVAEVYSKLALRYQEL